VLIENDKAIHLYKQCEFIEEGHLVDELFIEGKYRNVRIMYILQDKYLIPNALKI